METFVDFIKLNNVNTVKIHECKKLTNQILLDNLTEGHELCGVDNTHKEQLLEEDNIALEGVHETLAKLQTRKAPNPGQIANEVLRVEQTIPSLRKRERRSLEGC
ncbi:hypothetical protein Trydic_g12313 [Trypoxylus dichotomus]